MSQLAALQHVLGMAIGMQNMYLANSDIKHTDKPTTLNNCVDTTHGYDSAQVFTHKYGQTHTNTRTFFSALELQSVVNKPIQVNWHS